MLSQFHVNVALDTHSLSWTLHLDRIRFSSRVPRAVVESSWLMGDVVSSASVKSDKELPTAVKPPEI